MSEHDYAIADQSGTSFLSDLNSALAAIVSNNSKATAPTVTFAYQIWADTTSGLLKIRNASNTAWVDIGTIATTNLGLALVGGSTGQTFSVAAATAVAHAIRADQIQSQSVTAFTTAGTSSAFTLAPTPAIAANASLLRFNVTLNAAPTGSPTLAVSGKTALNFKYYDSTGTKQFITSAVAPSGWNSDVINDGTDWVMQKILQPTPATQRIIQVVNATPYTTNADLTTTTPIDDTVPTVSEGNQILTGDITTATATNKIKITASGTCSVGSNNNPFVVAIYRGSTCIQTITGFSVATTSPSLWSVDFVDSPASASTLTYSIRIGAGFTVRCNGTMSARLFGGSSACTMSLTEITA